MTQLGLKDDDPLLQANRKKDIFFNFLVTLEDSSLPAISYITLKVFLIGTNQYCRAKD